MLKDAQTKQVLDTKSATYQKVNRVFWKMKPFADQMNQTGQAFDWKVAVIKSKEINAYVAPGGKVVFYTGIVETLKLTDDEVAAIMGHEMVHALEEHAKNKIGAFSTNQSCGEYRFTICRQCCRRLWCDLA